MKILVIILIIAFLFFAVIFQQREIEIKDFRRAVKVGDPVWFYIENDRTPGEVKEVWGNAVIVEDITTGKQYRTTKQSIYPRKTIKNENI